MTDQIKKQLFVKGIMKIHSIAQILPLWEKDLPIGTEPDVVNAMSYVTRWFDAVKDDEQLFEKLKSEAVAELQQQFEAQEQAQSQRAAELEALGAANKGDSDG